MGEIISNQLRRFPSREKKTATSSPRRTQQRRVFHKCQLTFLVIEHGDHGNVRIVLHPAIADVFDQPAQREVAAAQVVQPGRVNELRVDAAEGRALHVEEVQLEVDHVRGANVQLGREEAHEEGLLPLPPLVIPVVPDEGAGFINIAAGAIGRGVAEGERLGSRRGDDGHEVILLVDLERLPLLGSLEVDGEVGYAQNGAIDLDELLCRETRPRRVERNVRGSSESGRWDC